MNLCMKPGSEICRHDQRDRGSERGTEVPRRLLSTNSLSDLGELSDDSMISFKDLLSIILSIKHKHRSAKVMVRHE